jgi:hypothetical protein
VGKTPGSEGVAVALFHVLRIFFGWPAAISGWTVPMWLSWSGPVVAGALSYFGVNLATRSSHRASKPRYIEAGIYRRDWHVRLGSEAEISTLPALRLLYR